MSEMDKNARELLAEAFACDEAELSREEVRAARVVLAWHAARMPPDGFVLLPMQATQEMYAAWMCSEGGWAHRYKALLAARPGAAND
ncbi:hypothetical protein [Stenotrophomonas chelatiphaga]|uniref:hypothetical protein n=1 Tax=Stenotrophomonas chelatiphaga TaxID=517011 RepID=UPI00289B056E|nr:hypothetical protein [Stenotrophomonas chelatiphaga]